MSTTLNDDDRSNDFDGAEGTRKPLEKDEKRAAAYRKHLRKRFGAGVPEAVVEAFEQAYELGWQSPDQIEALITGVRAGVRDKQRERCGGRL